MALVCMNYRAALALIYYNGCVEGNQWRQPQPSLDLLIGELIPNRTKQSEILNDYDRAANGIQIQPLH